MLCFNCLTAAMKSDGFSDLLGGFVPAMPDVTPVGEPQVPMSPLKPGMYASVRKQRLSVFLTCAWCFEIVRM